MIINEKSNSSSEFDQDLRNHCDNVYRKLYMMINDLVHRARHHDDSKFQEPEYSAYKKYTPILADMEYGSPEYEKIVNTGAFAEACDHHDANNRHHPEYFDNGISDMTLVDVIEMLSDWKAASERHQNATWEDGFNKNCERFNIDPQLKQILDNTVKYYFGG